MASVNLRQLSITTQDFPTNESGTILVDCIALTAANIETSLSNGSVNAIGCLGADTSGHCCSSCAVEAAFENKEISLPPDSPAI